MSELETRAGPPPEEMEQQVARLLSAREALHARIKAIAKSPPVGMKTRIHGDYHLGQVLIAKDDVVIIDFEGEPAERLPSAAKRVPSARRGRHVAVA